MVLLASGKEPVVVDRKAWSKYTPATLVAVGLLAIAGCGSTGGSAPSNLVETAAAATTSNHTAEIDMTLTTAGSAPSTMRLVYDFDRKLGEPLSPSTATEAQEIFDGSQVYVPLAPFAITGLLAGPAPHIPAGKKWLVFSFRSSNSETAAFNRLLYPYLNNESATTLLSHLAPIVHSMQQSGTAVINGAETTLYDLTVDDHALAALASSSTATEQVNNPVQLWVDSLGRVRQLQFTYSAAQSPAITERIDYSNFGIPVKVTVPPASQTMTVQQLLNVICVGAQQIYPNGCSFSG